MEKENNINCPYCHHHAEWVENKEVYGRNYGTSYMIWLCRPCDAYVGCHQNTRVPLGTMADARLRMIRRQAHTIIDKPWKDKVMARSKVYKMLSDAIGREVHVGESDFVQCEEIIQVAKFIFK